MKTLSSVLILGLTVFLFQPQSVHARVDILDNSWSIPENETSCKALQQLLNKQKNFDVFSSSGRLVQETASVKSLNYQTFDKSAILGIVKKLSANNRSPVFTNKELESIENQEALHFLNEETSLERAAVPVRSQREGRAINGVEQLWLYRTIERATALNDNESSLIHKYHKFPRTSFFWIGDKDG